MTKFLGKIQIIICMSLLLMPKTAHAQVKLTAQVDRTEVRLGDSIQLQIIVQGTRSSSQPQIPKTNYFNLSYHGQSSQFNWVNGKQNSSVTYSYTLSPLKKGQFTFGPARIKHKGKTLSSNRIKIKVLPVNATVKGAEPLILQTTVSNSSPYYNQQIVYTLQFARRIEVVNARVDLPKFEGFWVEDIGKQREGTRVINGHTYAIVELRKALFPNKTGPLEITPAAIHCDAVLPRRKDKRIARDPFLNRFFQDSFMSFRHRTVNKVIRSSAVKLEVKELPQKGKPANFYPLVGQIKVDSALSKNKLEAGDSSTLTITVSGNANIRDASLTEPEKIKGFKVYDDKPSLEFVPTEKQLVGKKVFKKALVPLTAGTPTTPIYNIPYFNPSSKHYEIASTRPISLQIKASEDKEKLHILGSTLGVAPKKEIKILGKDILTVYTHPNALENERLSSNENMVYNILFLLPPGIFLGLISVRKRTQLYQRNTAILRRKKALKQAQKKLKKLPITSNTTDFYPQLSKVIKEYLGDKLNLSGGVLTPQEIESKLQEAKVDKTFINEAKELMEQCDFCQFASSDNEQENCQQVFMQTQALLAKLEKFL